MEPEQRVDFLKAAGVPSAVDKIVKTGYKGMVVNCPAFGSLILLIAVNCCSALSLEYFFTAGKDEVRAWTIQVSKRTPPR